MVEVTLDKSQYVVGETVTLTVKTAPGEREISKTHTMNVSIDGLGEGTGTFKIVSDKPAEITIVSDLLWTLVNDDGNTAVYTTVATLP